MMNRPSKWHYPRTDLAKTYLKQLEAGLSSIAIFAERRKGKTEFLRDDITPIARERGLRTVYVNFWERKNDPVYCITKAVQRSLEQDSPRLFKRWKSEFSIKLGVLQAKTTVDSDAYPEIASDALDMLVKQKSDVLIMFDEIQHLATSPDYEELIATLRTFLDSNKRKVRAIFTGSSQDRLNKIFRRQNAAFYRGASLVEFPEMDEGFIRFLCHNFFEITKRKLPVKRVNEVFEKYNYSPFFVVDLLQCMMREGMFSIENGLDFYLEKYDPKSEWRDLWESLKLIDMLILKDVILNSLPLYHKDTYAHIADKIGLESVSRGMVQSAVKRLREQGVLNNEGHGKWDFESGEFKDFVVLEVTVK